MANYRHGAGIDSQTDREIWTDKPIDEYHEADRIRICAALTIDAVGWAPQAHDPVTGIGEIGDRVKKDRRDAENLAPCYRKVNLTARWFLDAAPERDGARRSLWRRAFRIEVTRHLR